MLGDRVVSNFLWNTGSMMQYHFKPCINSNLLITMSIAAIRISLV